MSIKTKELPPCVGPEDKVILFDGVCKLCNAWSNFIIKHDKKNIFKLASVQSEEGQGILAHFGMSTTNFDTMLYVEGSRAYKKVMLF